MRLSNQRRRIRRRDGPHAVEALERERHPVHNRLVLEACRSWVCWIRTRGSIECAIAEVLKFRRVGGDIEDGRPYVVTSPRRRRNVETTSARVSSHLQD